MFNVFQPLRINTNTIHNPVIAINIPIKMQFKIVNAMKCMVFTKNILNKSELYTIVQILIYSKNIVSS